jgi:hypothetical protein
MTLDPHRVYIEFLASRYVDEASAVKVLDAMEMPPPYPGSFDRIRESVLSKAPPDVARFLRGGHTLPSLQPLWEWALVQRFGILWAQEKVFRLHEHREQPIFDKVWELVRNIPLRNTVDAVMVQQWGHVHAFSLDKINDITSTRFGETLHETTFEMYRALFFNPTRVAKANWINYLDGCHPTRKEMLLLAMGQLDEQRFRHDLGAPPRFQYTHLLADVMATAYYRFKEEDARATADPKAMSTWAKTMMAAGEAREKHGQKDLADLRRDLQMGFMFLENDFPTLEDVESGRLDREMGRDVDTE